MKIRLHFKTPDVAEYALEDLSEDEKFEAEDVIAKFVEYSECISIELDTESGSAKVLPLVAEESDRTLQSVLELSTCHAPNSEPDFGPVRHSSHEYGWVVFVCSVDDQEEPEWLKPILGEARRQHCTLVLFDRDIEGVSAFDTYDW